jgi:hypothetical protein
MIAGRKQAGLLNKGQKRAPRPLGKRTIDGEFGVRERAAGESEKASFHLEIFGCKVGQCGLFPDWLICVLQWPAPHQVIRYGTHAWQGTTHTVHVKAAVPSCSVQSYSIYIPFFST